MNSQEARDLKPGDRVGFTSNTGSSGVVFSRTGQLIIIRWDSGAVVHYHADTIPHITKYPEGPHDR